MKNYISQIINHFKNCNCVQKACLFCTSRSNVAAVKMPIMRLVFSPFAILVDNAKKFFYLAVFYGIVISALSFLMGFAYICLFSSKQEGIIYCSNSDVNYIIYSLVKFFLIVVFAVKWGEIIFNRQNLSIKYLFLIGTRDLKIFLAFLIFIVLNLVPLLSLYILYIRTPNPDWVVEITFFAVVSLGFVVPFIVMRFYSVIAFIISGEKMPTLKDIWDRGEGNMVRLLVAIFFIVLLAGFSFVNFFFNFKAAAVGNEFYIGIISELLYNVIVLLLFALMVNHCHVQKEILFGGNQNESK